MSSEAGSHHSDWQKLARQVTRKVNTGWWLDRQVPIMIAVGLLAATVIICLRTFFDGKASDRLMLGVGAAIALVIGSLLAFLLARKRFINQKEGLVRLDDKLQLRNSLSSAQAGVGKWPVMKPAHKERLGLGWRWPVVLSPFLFAIAMIVAALYIPIVKVEAAAKLPPNEPGAWAQMEEWADTLEEEELIEEAAIEELREKIKELRNQPESEWFSHSSMEATDTLRESLGKDLRDLASEMNTIERDLNALQNHSTQLSESAKEMLMQEYEESLKNLETNSLEMNQELLQQLQNIDPKQLSQMKMDELTKEQMDQLRKSLSENGEKLGGMEGLPQLGEGDKEFEEWLAEQQRAPGNGGIQRGKGDAPIFFGDESDLKTNNIEKVSNPDLSRATPGDLLAVGETEHDIEEIKSGPQAGGSISGKGKGGEAVWRESLMPEEKAILKKYFK